LRFFAGYRKKGVIREKRKGVWGKEKRERRGGNTEAVPTI
jgi:hypothetical protein